MKAIDFGMAKRVAGGQHSLATMSTGSFVATAKFASPKQLEEKKFTRPND